MADVAKAFVAGFPIGHSRSPLIHRYWLRENAIEGAYEPLTISPTDFGAFVSELPQASWRGGNVTIPHKERAFDLIADHDDAAAAIGAVNTIWLDEGRLRASNTDAYGFSANLDERAPAWREASRALIIGAGGAARAILHALLSAGYTHIDVVNRTPERAVALADRFGPAVVPAPLSMASKLAPEADLIVNTSSLGMPGQANLDVDFETVADSTIVTDLVYVPLVTAFLALAQERGLKTVDGLGMLLHQAVPGFERWFGTRPSVTEDLRAFVIADLEGEAAQ